MHLLAESPPSIGNNKMFDRGYQHAEKLQDSEQTQEPQHPQIHRNKGLQVKRSYCQEINDGKRTEDVAQMGIALALELVVFWRQVQS